MRARAGVAEIVLCTITWGTIGPVVKQIELPAATIVFFRLALAMTVVLAWLAARGRLGDLRPRGDAPLLLTAGVVLGIHWVLLFESFKRLDVAATILIVFIGPVLYAVVAPAFFPERLRAVAVGALGLAFAGITLISVPEIDAIDAGGVAAALGSALLFAVMLLLGKRLTGRHEPAAIVAWQHATAAVLVSPALGAATASVVARELPLLVLLGAVHTGALSILFFRAVRALDASRLGVLFYLEPASAVLFAWVLLGEAPSAVTVAGGTLIVAAGLMIVGATGGATAPVAFPEPMTGASERQT